MASITYNLTISDVTYTVHTVTNVNPLILTSTRLDWGVESAGTGRAESTADTETIAAVIRNCIF